MVDNPCKHPDVRDVCPQRVKHERAFTDTELARILDAVCDRSRSLQRVSAGIRPFLKCPTLPKPL